jgi:PilZ domain
MSWDQADVQRRQFGRRDTNVRATALVPGYAPIVCELRNVSEGGALLVFEGVTVPSRPFRLLIDGTDLSLPCEVRHSGKNGTGVRFLSLQAGARLMGHLYREPLQASLQWGPDAETDAVVAIGARDLRDGIQSARLARYFGTPQVMVLKRKPRINVRVRSAMLVTSLQFAAVMGPRHLPRPVSEAGTPHYYGAT